MELIQRRAATRLLGGFAIILFILCGVLIFTGESQYDYAMTALAGAALASLTWLNERGWPYARVCAVLALDTIAALGLPAQEQYLAIILPILAAWVITDWRWIVLSAVIVYSGVLIRSGFQGEYMSVGAIGMYMVITGCLLIGRMLLDSAIALARGTHEIGAMQATTRSFAHQINQPLTVALVCLHLFRAASLEKRDEQDLAAMQTQLERIALLVRQFTSAESFQTTQYADGTPMLVVPPEPQTEQDRFW